MKKRSILIVDQDERVRDFLRSTLKLQGFSITLAKSSEESIDIVKSKAVDLSIIDINVPRLDGINTLKVINRMTKSLPCIFTSAWISSDLILRAFLSGAYTILLKPLDEYIINFTIERLIKKHNL